MRLKRGLVSCFPRAPVTLRRRRLHSRDTGPFPRGAMSSAPGVDYSAWDHIYVSDDEDVCSPFVDTASLYRMRHKSRLERTSELEQHGKDLRRNMSECKRKITKAQSRLKELENEGQDQDGLKELENEGQDQSRLKELENEGQDQDGLKELENEGQDQDRLKDLENEGQDQDGLKELRNEGQDQDGLKDLGDKSQERLKDLGDESRDQDRLKDLGVESRDQDRLKDLGDKSRDQDRLKDLGDKSWDQDRLKDLGVEKDQSQAVQRELAELREHLKGFEALLEVHEKEKRRQPWNVDTISKQGFSKSVVNTRSDAPEEKAEEGISFGDKYDKEIRHFGLLRRWEDSQSYLSERPHLVCEGTAAALVHICISMEREQQQSLMEQVAHQAIVMKLILDLAQSLRVDPRGCFRIFFSRIKTADQLYLDAFDQELDLLKQRVRSSAQSLAKEEEEEDEEDEEDEDEGETDQLPRLGPGGLDPREVYDSLPQEVQRGFDEKNVELLQRAMDTLHPEEAKFHLRRCIESGLWVPD